MNPPAKEAGIQVGNYITAVDGTDVKSMSSVDAIQTRLRGESGTTVNVTWLDSEASEHTADLTHSATAPPPWITRWCRAMWLHPDPPV